ncbi:hypothetical protein, partial [Actinoallomurus acaciae]
PKEAAVRAVARHWDLAVWDKPAAACMASRVAYGISVTPARLARVERAESAVRGVLGGAVRDLRVRDLGDSVRLEVNPELVERAREDSAVGLAIRAAGFASATINVEIFRSGSMNDVLVDSDTGE